MRVLELVLAIALLLGGIRSMWVWGRRPFEGTDVVDHVLYALFVTGRVGLWFAFSGFFFISASVEVEGRAATDELAQYRWYAIVPLGLAALQLGAGWFLGRRSPNGGAGTADPGNDGRGGPP
ncbi:MAG TPA: hypothetical protein VIC58_09690 [Actinomycetota bacterium]